MRELGQAEVYSAAMPHAIGQQSGRGATLQAAVEGWMAEAENAERQARHRLGMCGRVSRGLFANNPPLGYVKNGDGYEFSRYAPAVREMTRLFLLGHSYAAIVRALNAGPHPAPGRRWVHATVMRTLANPTYAGYPAWGAAGPEHPSAEYPALWDVETYRAILRERDRRRRAPAPRPESGPYCGVAFCARCGRRMERMVTRRPGHVYRYMRCPQHAKRARTGLSCHTNCIREEAITAALLAWLEHLATPGAIDHAFAATSDTNLEALGQDLETAGALAADLSAQRQRIALDRARGLMDGEMYRYTDDGLLAKLEAARLAVQQCRRQIAALPDQDTRRRGLAELVREFPALLDLLEPAEVSRLLQTAGVRIWCEAG